MKQPLITLQGLLLDATSVALIGPDLEPERADHLILRVDSVMLDDQAPHPIPPETIYVPFDPRLAAHDLLWHVGDRLAVTGRAAIRHRYNRAALRQAQGLRQREVERIAAVTRAAAVKNGPEVPGLARLVATYQREHQPLARLQTALAALPWSRHDQLSKLVRAQNTIHRRTNQAMAALLQRVGVLAGVTRIRTIGVTFFPETAPSVRMPPDLLARPKARAALVKLLITEAAALRAAGHLPDERDHRPAGLRPAQSLQP
ncbi:hypothetical protein [Lacticaseibacillus kribbianus]|uniref:hypothetical protein n=1 Tax=Lacticaseibacillus kribbianus TaxID=2926292 RepID=UPI001CD4F83B|nr:hypothetical protein [Lacticaseibacillus kribbianus]